MNLATIKVSGVQAVAAEYTSIPAGIAGATVTFEFTDPRWDSLSKTAVFRGCVTRDVIMTGNVVTVPHETVEQKGPRLMVGIYGVDSDNNLVIPTLWASLGMIRDAADPSGDPGTDPDLPIWAQLQAEIDALKKAGATDEQIAQAVADYLAENPIDPAGVVKSVNGIEPDENGNVEITIPDSGGNADQSGLSAEASTLLITILRNGVYGTDQSDNITALAAELGVTESEEEEPHTHSYTSAVTTAATCTTKGVRTYTCSCGESYTEEIPATGHSWNSGVVTVEPTEDTEGVRTYTCTVCGETRTETIPTLDHEHSYISNVVAPNCTEQGYTEHTCSCGDSYKDNYIDATGHNYVDGVCTVCGAADPDYEPEVTLTSISATYSGGDVTAGTAVADLTGISVTGHYSDGTSETVTGYTLSGTIVEGSNTVTVNYEGKTATFTVTGIAVKPTQTETLEIVFAGGYPNVSTFGWTEGGSGDHYAVAKQGSIKGGLLTVDFDPVECVKWNLNLYVFDANGNPYCQTDSVYSGGGAYAWGQNGFVFPGWEDVGAGTGFGVVHAPFSVQLPDGCTCIACIRRGGATGSNETAIGSNDGFTTWAIGGGITFTVTG